MTKIKAVIIVDINIPKSKIEKQSISERNDYVRSYAGDRLADILTNAELDPQILRVRLSQTKGEENNE